MWTIWLFLPMNITGQYFKPGVQFLDAFSRLLICQFDFHLLRVDDYGLECFFDMRFA